MKRACFPIWDGRLSALGVGLIASNHFQLRNVHQTLFSALGTIKREMNNHGIRTHTLVRVLFPQIGQCTHSVSRCLSVSIFSSRTPILCVRRQDFMVLYMAAPQYRFGKGAAFRYSVKNGTWCKNSPMVADNVPHRIKLFAISVQHASRQR